MLGDLLGFYLSMCMRVLGGSHKVSMACFFFNNLVVLGLGLSISGLHSKLPNAE